MFPDIPLAQIDDVVKDSMEAFRVFKKVSLADRAKLLQQIALELEARSDALIAIASAETHLPEARLQVEMKRTLFQLTSYAVACEKGDWLEIRIDTADHKRNPPKPDIRKMLHPLGPVVVFGASNFPFAYSTPGGDTATALAAGCTVIVKAHPAHAQTSQQVAEVIRTAVKKCAFPDAVFQHIHGSSFETGKALVTHPSIKAVGFTGSYSGGKQLFDWANQRKEPIPVFAEMGSVNPVFLFPEKLEHDATIVAQQYAQSITASVGQFCTNPGLLIGIKGSGLDNFIHELKNEIVQIKPAPMLHAGIAKAFHEKKAAALQQKHVSLIVEGDGVYEETFGVPTIATVDVAVFINNPFLHQEIFGPYSLLVQCKDNNELLQVARHLEGQITSSIIATDREILDNEALIEHLKTLCGRMVLNGVPTGVEVCYAMQHGGPFPATTDSRFTSVGPDAIKRFARPVAYQNWPDHLLPVELKNENPLQIWRMVNNEWRNDAIA
ncbi:MAG: aldehyde dehydrogenase (NADP(+)) [Bacteroidota bacterium]|nr:aldehyde dehydrogenase (NADP(+)) [Bacteroidota bacterium]